MSAIVEVIGREVMDSRGNPTVEAKLFLNPAPLAAQRFRAAPSTGSREAIELRDGDKSRFLGKGVLAAVDHVNGEIRDEILGLEVTEQALIDKLMIELDGTPNKARLGANAILAVSLAVARAAADELGLPLYRYFGGI